MKQANSINEVTLSWLTKKSVTYKRCLSLKVNNYSLGYNSKTSPRRLERSQRRLQGGVFNTFYQRRLQDLQISPLSDVSEAPYRLG